MSICIIKEGVEGIRRKATVLLAKATADEEATLCSVIRECDRVLRQAHRSRAFPQGRLETPLSQPAWSAWGDAVSQFPHFEKT